MNKPDNVEIRRKFGSNLRYYRKLKHISQIKLAEYIGSSQAAVSSWELGVREPELTTIFDIAAILQIPVSFLIPVTPFGSENEQANRMAEILNQNPRMLPVIERLACLNEKQFDTVETILNAFTLEEVEA